MTIKERAARLLCVKSIVTVLLTIVFCFLAGFGQISEQQFMTVFTVVIAFYYGTQAMKDREEK